MDVSTFYRRCEEWQHLPCLLAAYGAARIGFAGHLTCRPVAGGTWPGGWPLWRRRAIRGRIRQESALPEGWILL